jgi:hypothetical protein
MYNKGSIKFIVSGEKLFIHILIGPVIYFVQLTDIEIKTLQTV